MLNRDLGNRFYISESNHLVQEVPAQNGVFQQKVSEAKRYVFYDEAKEKKFALQLYEADREMFKRIEALRKFHIRLISGIGIIDTLPHNLEKQDVEHLKEREISIKASLSICDIEMKKTWSNLWEYLFYASHGRWPGFLDSAWNFFVSRENFDLSLLKVKWNGALKEDKDGWVILHQEEELKEEVAAEAVE